MGEYSGEKGVMFEGWRCSRIERAVLEGRMDHDVKGSGVERETMTGDDADRHNTEGFRSRYAILLH